MTNTKRAEQVEKLLRDNGVFCTAYDYGTLPVVVVSISWGDWKHEHLRADYLVEKIGGELLKVVETETDGSDCYSAERYYAFTSM